MYYALVNFCIIDRIVIKSRDILDQRYNIIYTDRKDARAYSIFEVHSKSERCRVNSHNLQGLITGKLSQKGLLFVKIYLNNADMLI